MRIPFGLMAAVVVLAASTSTVQAQVPSKPIDTNNLVVKPVDTTTSILGGTARYASRVTAKVLDNSRLLKTVNGLFGTTPSKAPIMQAGLSPLPHPSQYPSTYYKSAIQPVMPTQHTIQR